MQQTQTSNQALKQAVRMALFEVRATGDTVDSMATALRDKMQELMRKHQVTSAEIADAFTTDVSSANLPIVAKAMEGLSDEL